MFKRRDPKERLGDYAAALRFWLSLDAPWLAGIVFAENSGYDLKELQAAFSNPAKPIEWLSYDQPATPEGFHYGYSELILVRNAVSDSRLISQFRYFIKATGRYTFPGVGKLIAALPDEFDVAVDSRASHLFQKQRTFLTVIALAIFSRSFFVEHLTGLPERMVPGPPWNRMQSAETMLYDYLTALPPSSRLILRWPRNCEPMGIGANGDDYSKLKRRLQVGLRAVGRRIAPSVWI